MGARKAPTPPPTNQRRPAPPPAPPRRKLSNDVQGIEARLANYRRCLEYVCWWLTVLESDEDDIEVQTPAEVLERVVAIMGWSIGYDMTWHRDIGYGVPATCDHPGCGKEIDRGLAYLCEGCGLFFCEPHGGGSECERCEADPFGATFDPTPDVPEWITHKLTDPSWAEWRQAHPDEVQGLAAQQRLQGGAE